MRGAGFARAAAAGGGGAVGAVVARWAGAVTLEAHPEVARGVAVDAVDVRDRAGGWQRMPWEALAQTPREPGEAAFRVRVDAGRDGTTVQLPHCAGRSRVTVDGRETPSPPGPVLVGVGPGMHDVVVELKVSGYERRLACG